MSGAEIGSSLIENYAVYIASISAIISGIYLIYRKVVKPVFEYVKEWRKTAIQVEKIFEELTPNGGTSVKDKIDKIDTSLTYVSERLRAYLADVSEAHFETDAQGNYIRVNRTYTRLVGREPSEVLGKGWHNCIYQDDRESVIQAWEDSIDDSRELVIRFRFETPSGEIVPVRGTSYKMISDTGEVIGFLGKIIVDEEAYKHN